MDQKRFFVWIAISIAILLGFQYFGKHLAPTPPRQPASASAPSVPPPAAAQAGQVADTPRLPIKAPRVQGSINLAGARFDDLVLTDYRETQAKGAPLVLLFAPAGAGQPYYAQFGWSAAAGAATRLPQPDTLWKASAPSLTTAAPVTLSWDNGAGLTFELLVAIDANYLFTVEQRVLNRTGTAVTLFAWSRIRRETPKDPAGSYQLFGQRRELNKLSAGNYVLFEGLLGVLDGTLHEEKYGAAIKDGAAKGGGNDGLASQVGSTGGWIGITDKYWLAALIPDQSAAVTASFRGSETAGVQAYQVDLADTAPQSVAPGATASQTTRLFAGAKVVQLLNHYQDTYRIPAFWKAVDFGMFWFLTRPFFFCIDWLFHLTGNFGIAIMIFTVFVKAVFFPLANKSYRSMAKMRDLGPKMQAIRERYKEEPAKLQSEMLGIYKREGVNPASGCLPMIVQIPVFFSLYKVIYVTIEMRQAPFFGWIHDLSQTDPTNVFNLFGLIPFDPAALSQSLHLGIWPLILGVTMYAQQRLNPPPPDPMQARLFQFMPLIFTFMMARFPAGLVIYWSWNNLLTAAQQWLIMRRAGAVKA